MLLLFSTLYHICVLLLQMVSCMLKALKYLQIDTGLEMKMFAATVRDVGEDKDTYKGDIPVCYI